jgi:hypothetical protein
MSRCRLALVLAALAPCGCTLVDRAVYNIEYDKTLQADLADRSAYHRMLGEEAWGEAWMAGGEVTSDGAFGEGFVDGFADYLDHGGSGNPPAAPPNQYRFGWALSPEGHAEAARYSRGWAAGARAAQASGLRKHSLVPVLMPIPEELAPVERPAARPAELPPPGQLGPSPREVPAANPPGFRPEGTGAAYPVVRPGAAARTVPRSRL